MQQSLKNERDHTLGPDVFTGWKMKQQIQKVKQFPLIFTNSKADALSKSLTSFGSQEPYRIVYMGPRYTSNLKAFKAYQHHDQIEYDNEHGEMYGINNLQKYRFKHCNVKEKFFPIRPSEYRLFNGMNPTFKKQDLKFDSNFQCGNLDLAIYINCFQYDLLMRVDSNTKGHSSWFFFRVSNFTPKQKIKFNIINFQKRFLLYKDGMKPYVYTSSRKIWEQNGQGVEYKYKKFRYNEKEENQQNATMGNCLSFSYEFSKDDYFVYFAYCVPYSYSYLIHFLENLQAVNPHFVKMEVQKQSEGGLNIPIVTVTNFSTQSQKKVCLCTGRLHPGETQGSWMMEGFLRFLCSTEGYFLREKFIFKIVPMVNVDGVVLGNFRTGIAGRDLNRVFPMPEKYQEIHLIREIASKDKPYLYFDFHGHSAKKNVFAYGPDYSLDSKYYLSSRLYPKLISKKTEVFRYYACVFKISDNKTTTGRAIMLREHNVTFSFTIEASAHSYGPKNNEIPFTKKSYIDVGMDLAEGLIKFLNILFILPKRYQNKERKDQERSKSIQKRNKKDKNQKIDQTFSFQNFDFGEIGKEEADILKELLQNQNQRVNQTIKAGQSESDFEDETNDYTEKQLKKMFHQNSSKEALENLQEINEKKKHIKGRKLKNKNMNNSPKKILKKSSQFEQSELKSELLNTPSISLQKQRKIQKHKSFLNKVNSLNSDESLNFEPESKKSFFESKNESNFNQLHYHEWGKKKFGSIQLGESIEKAQSSVNNILINYSLSKKQLEYEPLRQKKQRERSELREKEISQLRKKYHKKQDKQTISLKPRMHDFHKEDDKISILSIKQSLLPILKKNHRNAQETSSILQQLLAQHEKSKYLVHKHVKILYL